MLQSNFNQPVDAAFVPRFAGVPTFMRLPYVPDLKEVDIALIGVPYDGGTTNRVGARHGPREIRSLSSMMRRVHPITHVGPYDLCRIADVGDVTVDPTQLQVTLGSISAFYDQVREANALPITAGGDHLITLPILRGLAKNGPVGLIQFDAHTDTNDFYYGSSKYNHGTPFRRAIEEGLLDPKRMVQIGIRGSIFAEDSLDYGREVGIRIITIDEYFEMGPDAVMAEARQIVGDLPTYVSFDIDSIDPAYAPGTGTPEIGGYTSAEALKMVRTLRGWNIIGVDVVEVSPPFDVSQNTSLVAATLMFEFMCLLAELKAKG